MLAEMSSRQFTEWQAFWQVEPWGEYKEDWRSAVLMTLIANMMRGKEQAPLSPQQFMAMLDPTGETEEPPTPEEVMEDEFERDFRKMLGEE